MPLDKNDTFCYQKKDGECYLLLKTPHCRCKKSSDCSITSDDSIFGQRTTRESRPSVCIDQLVCGDVSDESSSSIESRQKPCVKEEPPSVCIKQSVCGDLSSSSTQSSQKPCVKEEPPSVCIKQSVCGDLSSSSTQSSQKPCVKEEPPSVCIKQSVCGDVSDESSSSIESRRKPCVKDDPPSVCIKQSVCGDLSSSSTQSSQKPCVKEEPPSVCIDQLVCGDVSDESSSSIESRRKPCVKEEPPSVCINQSVCGDVSSSSTQSSQKPCIEEDTASVCIKQSVCGTESDDSSSSTRINLQSCIKKVFFGDDISDESSLFDCTCPRPLYSPCFDLAEDQDSFAEELLGQLPRTRYADDSRKTWEMILHCERAAFARTSLSLPLSSREARFYWHLYSSAIRNSGLYQKNLNHALLLTLNKLVNSRKQKTDISMWNQLIRPRTFDFISRETLINRLAAFIYKQNNLESICLEGLSLKPDEGIRLLTALYNSRETMKYVYCWRAFDKTVGVSTNDRYQAESRFCPAKNIEKCDWFRAIGCFECLTTLSINYAYIATPTGDLLISLAKKLRGNWKWLQLLCLEEEIPRNRNKLAEAVLIPEYAWMRAHSLAPMLKIQYAIIGIPEYDAHKLFLTKQTRVHTFALTTGTDLRFRQPWCLDLTIKTICLWYSDSLVYLCFRFWHNRENLDVQLKKIFLDLPRLRVFEYAGEIRMLKTLCAMCCQIRSNKCKVCRVNIELQKIIHEDIDEEKWIKSVNGLMVCFKHDFDKMGVKFDVSFCDC